LASLVIDRVNEDLQSTSKTPLIFFYCGSDESNRRTSASLLRTLIHQLLCTSPDLFEMIDIIYEKNRISGFTHGVLDFSDSKELLTKMLPKIKKSFIVIDALDECEAHSRREVLEALLQLSSIPNGTVKIFVSSRYSDDIALAFEDRVSLLIERQHNYDDISLFVQKEIDSAIRKKNLLRGKVDHELEQSLKRTLTRGANGMYEASSHEWRMLI
jgi:ankyrin repeat domain-containing protein 50